MKKYWVYLFSLAPPFHKRGNKFVVKIGKANTLESRYRMHKTTAPYGLMVWSEHPFDTEGAALAYENFAQKMLIKSRTKPQTIPNRFVKMLSDSEYLANPVRYIEPGTEWFELSRSQLIEVQAALGGEPDRRNFLQKLIGLS